MANCLENFQIPPCVWFEGDNKRNALASIMAGTLFFMGWWFIIDVQSAHPDTNKAYHVCGVFGTISLFMINSVSNALVRGDGYTGGCFGPRGARAWLFMGFVMGFGAVIASCWILFAVYVTQQSEKNAPPVWPGVVMPGKQWIFTFLIIAASILQCIHGIAVMSVDLGSEWMKIAIVSPGVPMEIALNKESKRKTPVAIAFRDGERLFGEDALGVGVRFPRLSYAYLLDLLGKRVDHPSVKLFQQRFPETQFSPEQLLAQLLAKAREFAAESARQVVNEAVLTVPGFFNQVERRALLQAADLAGIKVLQLINDYTAGYGQMALNYGIFRRKDFNESAQYIMFYDMGASSTTATLVSYQLVKTKEKGFVETNPQLAILGVGYDRTLGGLEMQLRLRDHLGKKFNEMKKTSNDVFGSPRALAKLFKEAGRLKNVLSANTEHHAQAKRKEGMLCTYVENLLDDQDFKLLVTRDDFESLCADLFDRVQAPVDQALKTSGLTMDVINQVILVGAGTRVPKVQEKLAAYVGTELGKNLNTDEAAAMGAVYKAADLSTGFKVKKFVTKDAVLFPIQVVFEREVEGQPIPKQVKRILFGPMNPYPQKKVLTFNKHTEDFEFSINYADLDHLPEQEIHGILGLVNVELVLEKTLTEEELRQQEEAEESPLSKLGSTISNFFTATEDPKPENKQEEKESQEEEAGGDEKKEEAGSEEKAEEAKKEEGKKDKEEEEKKKEEKDPQKKKEDAAKNTTTETKKAGDKKPKVVVIKEQIEASETKLGVTQLSEAQLQESAKKLDALNEFDRQRVRRASALNSLESFVFDAQAKLEVEEFQQAASEAEIEKIRSECSEVSDWLYEDGLEADADTYEAKLTHLKTLTQPLYKRVREHQERPGMLDTLHQALNGSANFLASARNMTAQSQDDPLFTAVELETLEKVIKETQEWKTKMEGEQAALKLSDTPKLTIKAIGEKLAQLDREVKYLVNKAKIWRPSKTKDDKEKESPNDTISEPSAEEPEVPEQASEGDKASSAAKEDSKDSTEKAESKPSPSQSSESPSPPLETSSKDTVTGDEDDILPRRQTADAARSTEDSQVIAIAGHGQSRQRPGAQKAENPENLINGNKLSKEEDSHTEL
ncbi:Major heat shock 70 kDa protein Ba [Gryllus bimaculatus]|nr:Major heat shock 70 kDa protein Ba [Gryllus bimaculatus]